jgi:hypothetical protein
MARRRRTDKVCASSPWLAAMRTPRRRFLRRLLMVPLVAIVGLAGVAAWDVATYDRAAWQADFTRLKRDMAQGYANLDWIASQRGLDLARLDSETTAAIDGAHSRLRALLAIRGFVAAFRDPHLRLEWGDRPIRAETAVDAAGDVSDVTAASAAVAVAEVDPPAGKDCAEAGYSEDDHAFSFPFERLPGWRTLDGGDFPTGLAGDTGDTGVIRIAQFGEERYAAACTRAFTAGIGQRALQLKVRGVQQDALREALARLRAAGAKRVLVDVTGNGGGSEWVAEVTALFTDRLLERAEARVVAPTCDRAAVWRGVAPCPVLEADAGRARLQGTGAWTGPVLVLADRHTASASEDLVAWLQQNRVARVIGARTMGAGCGYMDGGGRTQFRASRFDVRMPNCARFLDDGTDEIEGIAPDLAIPMDSDDPQALADALAAALAKA